MWKFVIGAVLTVLATGSTWALDAPERVVQRIPSAHLIDGWQKLDSRRLLVSGSAGQGYVLTLRTGCHALRFAEQIGVSTSNDALYAGFDSLTVDGQQCPIQTIHAVSRERVERLRSGA